MNEDKIINYYNKFNENKRMTHRHAIVEYETANYYLHQYLKPGMKIIDIGAGTGVYSIPLSNEGYEVTSVELVKHNLKYIEEYPHIKTYLRNAIDLHGIKNNSYDIVILFGPMYHLLTHEEQIKAMMEAKRVLKDDGIIFVSYIMNEYAIIKHGFMEHQIINEININLVDDSFHVIHDKDDLYTMYRLEDIDLINQECGLKRIKIISQDGLTDYIRKDINDLSNEEFKLYLDYHLKVCERYELLGFSSHVLDIIKKDY